jgi:hypothetical protein
MNREFDEREAYEDLSLDELERRANEQLAQANPEAVDPNPSGRNTENQGAIGRFDGLISANFRRPDSLDQGGETKESEAPNMTFWTSSAIPPKKH